MNIPKQQYRPFITPMGKNYNDNMEQEGTELSEKIQKVGKILVDIILRYGRGEIDFEYTFDILDEVEQLIAEYEIYDIDDEGDYFYG